MNRKIQIGFLVVIVLILAVDLVGFLRTSAPSHVRLHSPVSGSANPRSFLAAGFAWTAKGLPAVEVRAVHLQSGAELRFPAVRDTVRYRGVVVASLAAFSARVELPEEGRWELRAVLGGPSGELRSPARVVSVRAGARDRLFTAFGGLHLAAFGVLAALLLAVVLRYRTPRAAAEVRGVSLALAAVLLADELFFHVWWIAIGGWTVSNNLMLHMCGLAILVVPFVLLMRDSPRRQWLFEVSYFWCLGGAFQAYLAPDIGVHSFPEPRFFTFFLSHGFLVVSGVFLALTSGMRLTFRSYLRAGAVTAGVTALCYGINQLLGLLPPYEPANYFMIGYPPPTGSIIDLFANIFGPSPAYGAGLFLMGVVLFYVLYLPFPLVRLARSRAVGSRPAE